MFHKLAVCTAVLVAILSNDTLALKQGGSLKPTTGGGHEDSYATNNAILMVTPQTPPNVTPVVNTSATKTTSATATPAPAVLKTPTDTNSTVRESSHATDCNPNFPSEKTENPAVATPPVEKSPKVTEPSMVTPALTMSKTDPAFTPKKPTAQQANTESGNQNNDTSASSIGFIGAGAVAAVAAVGAVASQVKKNRDADAALVTPGEDETIHIEIKRTPAGGSTIL